MRLRHSQRNNTSQMEQRNIHSQVNEQRNRARNDHPSLVGDYMTLEFKYSFQDYLKMALCKMVPHEGILFNQREGFIYGPREECIKLKKKVQKELTSRKYKKIQFKKDADLDEIDYELDCKFQARIFRGGFIERALNAIADFDGLEKPCCKFRKAISDGKTIILRVKSDFEDECMEKIDKILKRSSSTGKEKPNKVSEREQEEQYEQIVEEEANYYQMMQAEKNEQAQCQKMLEQLNESKVLSQPESSFTLTQTDSSHIMEEQPDSLLIEQPSKVNKSFM